MHQVCGLGLAPLVRMESLRRWAAIQGVVSRNWGLVLCRQLTRLAVAAEYFDRVGGKGGEEALLLPPGVQRRAGYPTGRTDSAHVGEERQAGERRFFPLEGTYGQVVLQQQYWVVATIGSGWAERVPRSPSCH